MAGYKFEISGEGMKRVLEDTFSVDTWLSELAQNAQRAGASRLELKYNSQAHSLVVTDDGCGFDDDSWKAYFTVASSGWDQSVMDSQKPFGIGCASLLYACTKFSIFSRSSKVAISTADFLSGGEVRVKPSDSFINGSIFEIALKDSVKFNVDGLRQLFEGFQIPVICNGVEIARPFSLDTLSSCPNLVEFEYGQIAVKSVLPSDTGRVVNDLSARWFLQGLSVSSNRRYPSHNIVHLDATRVRARVPDRAELVGDVDAVKAACSAAISRSYKRQLSAILDDIGIDAFSTQYWSVAMRFSPDLLSSAPVPLSLFWSVESLAYGEVDGNEDHYKTYLGEGLLREHDTRVVIADDGLDFSRFGTALEDEGSEFNRLNFLYASSLPIICRSNLPEDHWLSPRLVSLDEAVFSVAATDSETIIVDTAGFYRHSMVLCAEYTIAVSGAVNDTGSVVIDDVSIARDAMVLNGTTYMPAGETCFYGLCRQCCQVISGEWSDEFDEDYLDTIVAELTSVMLLKRGGSVENLLKKFLDAHARELSYFAELPNQRFSLSFSGGAKPAAIVDLVAN